MGLFGKKRVTTKEIMVDGVLEILSKAESAPQWEPAAMSLVTEETPFEQINQELINLQFFAVDLVIHSNYNGEVRDQMRDILLVVLERKNVKAFQHASSRQMAYGDAYVNNPLEHMPKTYSLAKRFCQFCGSDGDPVALMTLTVCIKTLMDQLNEFVQEINSKYEPVTI
jgi:hypothetical protein